MIKLTGVMDREIGKPKKRWLFKEVIPEKQGLFNYHIPMDRGVGVPEDIILRTNNTYTRLEGPTFQTFETEFKVIL